MLSKIIVPFAFNLSLLTAISPCFAQEREKKVAGSSPSLTSQREGPMAVSLTAQEFSRFIMKHYEQTCSKPDLETKVKEFGIILNYIEHMLPPITAQGQIAEVEIINQIKTLSLNELAVALPKLYGRICSLPDTQRKLDLFEAVIQGTDKFLLAYEGEQSLREVAVQLKALTLRQKGAILHNVVSPAMIKPTEETLKLVRQAKQLIEQSCTISASIKDTKNELLAKDFLGQILDSFSVVCALRALEEEDANKAISLWGESIDSMTRSHKILPDKINKVEFSHLLLLSLHRMLNIYTQTSLQFNALCESKEMTMARYAHFIKISELTHQLLEFMNQHILTSSLDFLVVSAEHSKKNRKKKGSAPATSSSRLSSKLANLAPIMDPHTFLLLPWSLYCGALRGAAVISLDIPCEAALKSLYAQKSKDLLAIAIEAYKKQFYQGEYAGDLEKEEIFIIAQLDDLIGNSAPLTQFYKKLHQERRAKQHQKWIQSIKAELEEREKGQQEAQRAQQIASQKESAQSSVAPLPRAQTAAAPSRHTYAQPVAPSLEAYLSSHEHQKTSPIEMPSEPKVKVKTRGVAQESPVIISQAEPLILEEEVREWVVLSSHTHGVFHSLTGGIINRNILLDDVKSLLGALKCEMKPGSRHGIAKAPNGTSWAIPQAWDGPIPACYRQQLNHFLQILMELDPHDVITKD